MTKFLKFYICFFSLIFAQETRVREFEFGKIQIGHASASIRAFHLRDGISEFRFGPTGRDPRATCDQLRKVFKMILATWRSQPMRWRLRKCEPIISLKTSLSKNGIRIPSFKRDFGIICNFLFTVRVNYTDNYGVRTNSRIEKFPDVIKCLLRLFLIKIL